MGKAQLKSRMKNLLMFLPNMVVLCARLMVDSRVPRVERALFAAAIIYAIIPFDFIPDMIPFVGQIDDLFLISLTLLRLIDRTDDIIVREHWRGGGDIVQLAESAATLAPLPLDGREQADLELIATGAASPLTGFLGKADYDSVLESFRLADGTVWPLPFTLAVADGIGSLASGRPFGGYGRDPDVGGVILVGHRCCGRSLLPGR